jgi:hypothetical protein
MRRNTERTAAWGALAALGAIALGVVDAIAAQSRLDRRQQQRVEEGLRREGEALLRLADAAMTGDSVASELSVSWRHDFLKAQPGTFVPFTITIDRAQVTAASGLLYVRAVGRGAGTVKPPARGEFIRYPVDVVFPVEFGGPAAEPIRISRGIMIAPGEYDVIVVVRERAAEGRTAPGAGPKAAVLRRSISVPDFWTGELTTSTIMLAERIDVLPAPLSGDALQERPYVIGRNAVRIAPGASFRRDRELIVVFVIYNPTVTAERHFDLQVDYQVYRRASGGERFVTRTEPQRFNPSVLGPGVDPASGQPVMAGQGILLSSFEEGEYRLGITVTDLLSRKTLSRDVTFSVVGS